MDVKENINLGHSEGTYMKTKQEKQMEDYRKSLRKFVLLSDPIVSSLQFIR